MNNLKFEYTNQVIEDSIAQKISHNGALIIESRNRIYFISKDFIEWAYKTIHEREDKNKA